MSFSVCANRHAHDFDAFGSPCPDCGAILRFRTRYVKPDKTTKARMLGCELQHPDVADARSIASFYEFSLRDGFKRERLARLLAQKLIHDHPIWKEDAATDAAFALICCRDEIERDALIQAARRRALREKRRAEQTGHLTGV